MTIEDDDIEEALSIEDVAELLRINGKLDVVVKQPRKDFKYIQVNSNNPFEMRKRLMSDILPDLDLDFNMPRKTKKDGLSLEIVQDGSDEIFILKIRKGGDFRGGRKNELNFQSYIKNQLEQNGECVLHVSDNYGVKVDLDIVDVIDTSTSHGTNGELNRADTTVKLKDGSLYGISQKKTNATYVCKIKKLFKEILFQSEKRLREYAKEHGLQPGDYMDIRITQRDLIDLCWFGTDIAQGAAFIGNLEDINGNDIQIERIIQNGDDDVLTSFPIYVKWRIVNKAYTMQIQGVCVPSLNGKWVIDDLELPGINAPMQDGKKFKIGQEEPKRKHRRRRKRRVSEDGSLLTEEERLVEEARQNDLWDTIAYCAENHKMVWLKYETVEDGNIISRKVAPYSYRTRNTKIRGRSTYFYGQDFTPGEDHTIKCFLIENCLQAKESTQSFHPRFPIEIKQEIDRLEQKRKEQEIDNDKDGVIDDGDEQEIERIKNKDKNKDKDNKSKEKHSYKDVIKDKKNIAKAQDDGENDAKDDIEQITAKDKPLKEPPPPPPTPKDNKQQTNPASGDQVTIDTNKDKDDEQELKDGEVQVTDDEGNVI